MPSWGQEYEAWAVVFWVILAIVVVVGGIALLQRRRASRGAKHDIDLGQRGRRRDLHPER